MAEKVILYPSQVTESDWIWAKPSKEAWNTPGGGKWLLYFTGIKEDDDLTDQDNAWSKIVKLVGKGILTNAKASTSINSKFGKLEGKSIVIMCYTSDYSDIDDIRSSAIAIRKAVGTKFTFHYKTNKDSQAGIYPEHGYSSVSLYKFNSKNLLFVKGQNGQYFLEETAGDRGSVLTESDAQVPSKITNKEYIWAKEGDSNQTVPKEGGKWIVIRDITTKDSNGLTELDRAWQKVLNLVREGVLLTARCSTPVHRMSNTSAAILCHTSDHNDVKDVKRVADTIRKELNVSSIFYYKMNTATRAYMSLRSTSGSSLTKYMHTSENLLYRRCNGSWSRVAI